ncbi:MAG: hypothetical protein HKN30_00985 [Sulfitobacter sp.]|nr:hypothetical protein [Sulfitobacter sp.]
MTQKDMHKEIGTVRRVAAPGPEFDLSDVYLRVGKRAFDIIVSLQFLIFFAPVMLVVAVLAGLDGGSPLFGHERIGQNGRRFRCLKFRTMRVDAAPILADLLERDPEAAAEWARDHKLTNDPRITAIGGVLRRTSLDELPQLLNVLRGDMSLVGPRPVTEEELLRYEHHITKYLSLRPGLTGLWQVHGRGRVGYKERVEMDAQYFWTANFWGDLKLLLLTSAVVFQRRGQ